MANHKVISAQKIA